MTDAHLYAPLTVSEAEQLAESITSAIAEDERTFDVLQPRADADRQSVASDLVGIRLLERDFQGCVTAESYAQLAGLFSGNLRRMARLYGV